MSRNYLKRIGLVVLPALLILTVPAVLVLANNRDRNPPPHSEDDDSGRPSEEGYLGVNIQRLDRNLRDAFDIPRDVDGVLVSNVVDDSPADDAGLRNRDVITKVNGSAVMTERELTRAIRALKPGDTADLSVWRDGKILALKAKLGSADDAENDDGNYWVWNDHNGSGRAHPAPAPRAPRTPMPPEMPRFMHFESHGQLGVQIQDLNPEIAPFFSAPNDRGALVWQVDEGSAADKAGIKAGDVIVEVEGEPVRDSQDLREVLSDHDPAETVAVKFLRKGSEMTVKATLDESRGLDAMMSAIPRIQSRLRSRDDDEGRSKDRLQDELKRLQERLSRLKDDLDNLKD